MLVLRTGYRVMHISTYVAIEIYICRDVLLIGGVACEGRGAVRGAFRFVHVAMPTLGLTLPLRDFPRPRRRLTVLLDNCMLCLEDSVDIYFQGILAVEQCTTEVED
jgi:hypothetical protein